jgi:hypothetical protein
MSLILFSTAFFVSSLIAAYISLIDFMMAKTSNHKVCNKVRQMDNKVKICYMSETYQNYEEARKVFPGLEIKCFIPKLAELEVLTKINQVLK